MSIKDDDLASRTIEMRLDHAEIYPLLDQLLSFYATQRHRLWRDLVIKGGLLSELKRSYIADYGLTARQFNSLAKEVTGKAKALEELEKERRFQLGMSINATSKTISKLEKSIKVAQATIKAIDTYRLKVKQWKERAGSKQKKPKMPAKIKTQFTLNLKQDVTRHRSTLHQKKRRLDILTNRLRKLDESSAPSLCFGSKALFRKQFHLEAANLRGHEEWLIEFRQHRSSQAFFIGSSDETAGNQTVQYDPKLKTMRLRLPNALPFKDVGTHLTLDRIDFPEHLRDEFLAALACPDPALNKNRKSTAPISYRLVRRVNENTAEKAYYLQASFGLQAPELITRRDLGVIGVDMNADHLAVAETDRFGNLIDSFILPFDFKNLKATQTEALIGDLSAVLAEHCQSKGKALVIEELDFEEKKKALREQPKVRRSFLSAFAYAQFHQSVSSRTRADGIELIPINPAYTSLIGAYKYQGLAISSHEKAALAIARRAQGYSEGLGVFQGTLPTQAMMSEKTRFTSCPRHVWGFYSDHRLVIRKLLIEPDKRPLLPLARALSLAKEHPSLHKSYIETGKARTFEALRCASG